MTTSNQDGAQQQPDTLREALEQCETAIRRLAERLDKEPGNQIVVALWLALADRARAALDSAQLVAQQQQPSEPDYGVLSAEYRRLMTAYSDAWHNYAFDRTDNDHARAHAGKAVDQFVYRLIDESQPQQRTQPSEPRVGGLTRAEWWAKYDAGWTRTDSDNAFNALLDAVFTESQPQQRTQPSEPRSMVAALSWALDMLDLYDERLAQLDGPDRVYSAIHVAGKAKARRALEAASVLPSEPWLIDRDGDSLPRCPECLTTARDGDVVCAACGCRPAATQPTGDSVLRGALEEAAMAFKTLSDPRPLARGIVNSHEDAIARREYASIAQEAALIALRSAPVAEQPATSAQQPCEDECGRPATTTRAGIGIVFALCDKCAASWDRITERIRQDAQPATSEEG